MLGNYILEAPMAERDVVDRCPHCGAEMRHFVVDPNDSELSKVLPPGSFAGGGFVTRHKPECPLATQAGGPDGET